MHDLQGGQQQDERRTKGQKDWVGQRGRTGQDPTTAGQEEDTGLVSAAKGQQQAEPGLRGPEDNSRTRGGHRVGYKRGEALFLLRQRWSARPEDNRRRSLVNFSF